MYSKLLLAMVLAVSAFASSATTTISGTKDYAGATVGTSCDGQSESQAAVFELKDGATLKNVVLKSGAAADGVHCLGSCTLVNVKWPDVCEDAATMLGGSGKTMTVTGGSAASASDKVFQHNGKGSTVSLSGFAFGSSIGKGYRSCGNCSSNGGPRYVKMNNVTFSSKPSSGVVGINGNFGDVATITNLTVPSGTKVCVVYTGVQSGSESPKIGEQWNNSNCKVKTSDVTYK